MLGPVLGSGDGVGSGPAGTSIGLKIKSLKTWKNSKDSKNAATLKISSPFVQKEAEEATTVSILGLPMQTSEVWNFISIFKILSNIKSEKI